MIASGLLATGLLEGEYLKALVGAAIIGVVAPVVGTWIVLRRMANLGDTMSHGTLAGVGIAYAAQEIASVPVTPRDARLDLVLTEREIIDLRGS